VPNFPVPEISYAIIRATKEDRSKISVYRKKGSNLEGSVARITERKWRNI
jgi:hypothetical protein